MLFIEMEKIELTVGRIGIILFIEIAKLELAAAILELYYL